MPIARFQCNLPRDSGLPEDDVVNVWHFDWDPLADDPFNNVANRLIAFYNAIEGMLAGLLTGAVNIKGYLLPDPGAGATAAEYQTGPPDFVGTGTFQPNISALPAECAAAVTLHAENSGDLDVPVEHRRGRVYIGCLSTSLAQGTIAGDLAIESTEANVILNAVEALADAGVDAGKLAVYSPTWHRGRAATSGGRPGGAGPKPAIEPHSLAESTFDVTRVSMDNRLDTQRRRGGKATARYSVNVTT